MLTIYQNYFPSGNFPDGTWFPVEIKFHQIPIPHEDVDLSGKYTVLIGLMDCGKGEFELADFARSLALDDTMCESAVLERSGPYFSMAANAVPGSKLFPVIPKRSAGPMDTLVAVPLEKDQEAAATLDDSRWRDLLAGSSKFYLLGRFDDVFDWVRFEREK